MAIRKTPGARVQIPAWSDSWMQGDRFGTVIKYTRMRGGKGAQIAHVQLDKSGTVKKFLPAHLTEVG